MVGNRCQTARCWKELPVLGILSSVTQYYDQKGSYCRGLVSKYAKILFTTVHDLYTIFWTFTFKSSNRKQGVFLTLRTTGRRKRKMFAQQLIQMHTNAGSVFSGDSAHGYRTQTPNCIRALQPTRMRMLGMRSTSLDPENAESLLMSPELRVAHGECGHAFFHAL